MIKNRSAYPFAWDWERGLEYYNGKLVCVESSSSVYMTKGKSISQKTGEFTMMKVIYGEWELKI